MKRLLFMGIFGLLWSGLVQAELETQTLEYHHAQTSLLGYLAYPKDAITTPRPGVLVVPEWWGLNDYAKRRAEQLAGFGYIALAADIYGDGQVATDPKQAGTLASRFRDDRELMRARARAGLDALRAQPGVDSARLAAIGYCFGGTTVLELARSGAELAGVVSFHGGLDTPDPADAENIQAKVLVLHGGDDPYVPPEQVIAFMEEMRQADVDWQLVAYGGAVHAFTNPDAGDDPSQGIAYHATADRRSWVDMQQFFAELFMPMP